MSKRIVSVDVQPQYLDDLNKNEFDIKKYCKYINSSSERMPISFMFNDYTHGIELDEKKYKKWLLSIGISKQVVENINTRFLKKKLLFYFSFIQHSWNKKNN